jgi:hypothetical protein
VIIAADPHYGGRQSGLVANMARTLARGKPDTATPAIKGSVAAARRFMGFRGR